MLGHGTSKTSGLWRELDGQNSTSDTEDDNWIVGLSDVARDGKKVESLAEVTFVTQRRWAYNWCSWDEFEPDREVIMAKLTEEAKKAIGAIRPSLVATASKIGKPNVSAKGSLRVLDDDHVIFADIASPRTLANIKENPQVAIICLDAPARKGCRIWGRGEILGSGELFDKVVAEYARRNMKVRNVVKVAVEEVETF